MLSWLFDTDCFVPRTHCGAWEPWVQWSYIIGHLVIAVAYYAIPLCLVWLYRRRRDMIPTPSMLLLFATFIMLCGTTHVLDALTFYVPMYRLNTLVIDVTAAVSFVTAVRLPGAIRYFMTYASPEEKRRMIEELKLNIEAREVFQRQLLSRNENLKRESDTMREIIAELEGRKEIKQEVMDLREQLHRIRNV